MLGFLFALRAQTVVSIRLCDVVLRQDHLELREYIRKSRRPQQARTLSINITHCDPAKRLYQYFKGVQARVGTVEQTQPAFAFVSSLPTTMAPAGCINHAIQEVFSKLNLSSSDDMRMTSHSLRRGAAVSMHTLDVPLSRILNWGAWASMISFKPYIQGRVWTQASKEDHICFDHLTRSSLSSPHQPYTLHRCNIRIRKNQNDGIVKFFGTG